MIGFDLWMKSTRMLRPKPVHHIMPFRIKFTPEDVANLILFDDDFDYEISFEEVLAAYRINQPIGDTAIRKWVRQQIGRR